MDVLRISWSGPNFGKGLDNATAYVNDIDIQLKKPIAYRGRLLP
jgi:hypothetical protein